MIKKKTFQHPRMCAGLILASTHSAEQQPRHQFISTQMLLFTYLRGISYSLGEGRANGPWQIPPGIPPHTSLVFEDDDVPVAATSSGVVVRHGRSGHILLQETRPLGGGRELHTSPKKNAHAGNPVLNHQIMRATMVGFQEKARQRIA